jgi:hypothetical protein
MPSDGTVRQRRELATRAGADEIVRRQPVPFVPATEEVVAGGGGRSGPEVSSGRWYTAAYPARWGLGCPRPRITRTS